MPVDGGIGSTVGVLGAGTIGAGVAQLFITAGHTVAISNRRGPHSLAEVVDTLGPNASAVTLAEAACADIVLLAVPWTAVEDVLTLPGSWQGRVLIDATNAIKAFDPPRIEVFDFGDLTSSEVIATRAPGARVVKAFNHLPFHRIVAPVPADEKRVMFICGDDTAAKNIVAAVLDINDYATIDLGTLAVGAPLQQIGGPLASIELRTPAATDSRNGVVSHR